MVRGALADKTVGDSPSSPSFELTRPRSEDHEARGTMCRSSSTPMRTPRLEKNRDITSDGTPIATRSQSIYERLLLHPGPLHCRLVRAYMADGKRAQYALPWCNAFVVACVRLGYDGPPAHPISKRKRYGHLGRVYGSRCAASAHRVPKTLALDAFRLMRATVSNMQSSIGLGIDPVDGRTLGSLGRARCGEGPCRRSGILLKR